MSTSRCDFCERTFDNDADPQCRRVPYYDDGTTVLLCEDCRTENNLFTDDD